MLADMKKNFPLDDVIVGFVNTHTSNARTRQKTQTLAGNFLLSVGAETKQDDSDDTYIP